MNRKFCAHAHEQTTPFNRLYLLKGDHIGEYFFLGGEGGIKSACVERKQDYRANLNTFNVIDSSTFKQQLSALMLPLRTEDTVRDDDDELMLNVLRCQLTY